jgi:hypothetical protein
MVNKKAMLTSVGGSPYNIPFLNFIIGLALILIYFPCTIFSGQLCFLEDYFTFEVNSLALFIGEVIFLLIVGGAFLVNGLKTYKISLKKIEGDCK